MKTLEGSAECIPGDADSPMSTAEKGRGGKSHIRAKEKLASDGYTAWEAILHVWPCGMRLEEGKSQNGETGKLRCCYSSIGKGLCRGRQNDWEIDTFLPQ